MCSPSSNSKQTIIHRQIRELEGSEIMYRTACKEWGIMERCEPIINGSEWLILGSYYTIVLYYFKFIWRELENIHHHIWLVNGVTNLQISYVMLSMGNSFRMEISYVYPMFVPRCSIVRHCSWLSPTSTSTSFRQIGSLYELVGHQNMYNLTNHMQIKNK